MTNPFNASEEIFSGLAKKMGFFDTRFITNWKDIVGEELALQCTPTKLIFDPFKKDAVLFIASNNLAFKSMFIHYKSSILNKVQFYFGVSFVKDIKVTNK